jgi:hypothetical protein
MARSGLKTAAPKQAGQANPFKRSTSAKAKKAEAKDVHIIRNGVRCDTEKRGHATSRGRTPLEIVVDASEGFIPLWAKGTILRWRFRNSSFAVFDNPAAAKAAVEQLLGKAILRWGESAPVKFAKRVDTWDFEIVMRSTDDCDDNGCVLASAFFPDAGRHKLVLYPRLFEQSKEEQIETLIHEIGHIFGLRHFFALVSETDWPAEIFGEHKKFSIMNYGDDSKLTLRDQSDLKRLYRMVWGGQLTEINGTPIRVVRPFHASGASAESPLAVAAARTVVAPLAAS